MRLVPRLLVGGEDWSGLVPGTVTVRHGRTTPREQPDASTLTVTLPERSPAASWLGQPVTLDAVLDDVPLRRFTGRVTDAVGTWVAGVNPGDPPTPYTTIVATGSMAGLGRRVIGDTPWPAESDGARVARILDAATSTISRLDHASTSGFSGGFFPGPGEECTVTAGTTVDGKAPCWSVTVPEVDNSGGTLEEAEWAGFLPHGQAHRNSVLTVTGWLLVEPDGFPVNLSGYFEEYDSVVTIPADGAWHWFSVTVAANNDDWVPLWCGAASWYDRGRPNRVHAYGWRLSADPHPFDVEVDPGTVTVRARDVDRRPALTLAHEVAESAAGLLTVTREGLVRYEDAAARATLAARSLRLTGTDVLDAGLAQELHVTGLVNDVTIAYGPQPVDGTQRPEYRLTDPASVAAYGEWGVRVDSVLAAQADAASLAAAVVGRNALPLFTSPEVVVDVPWLLARDTPDVWPADDAWPADDTYPGRTAALLSLEVSDLVDLVLPAGAPTAPEQWVEGWLEVVDDPDTWRVTLALSDHLRYGAPPTWAQGDPDTAWAEVPSDARWLDDALDPLPA
jgi:hypothetical protein